LPELVRPVYDGDDNQFLLEDNGNRGPRTQIMLSQRGEAEGGVVTYRIALSARRAWELEVDVVPDYDGRRVVRGSDEHRFGDEVRHVRASLAAWHLSVPRLSATWSDLGHSFSQSVADLASLRIRGRNGTNGELPAAGMPWFMTVFGRDTLITCLQTLLFGPDLARSALEALAELQAREDDPSVDAEPGKIVHEVRHGKAAEAWFSRYYGTVDATPLYLVLFSEVWRWTDDVALARDFMEPALRALEWIDESGDRDGVGFVEFPKRSPHGLYVPALKDSFHSPRFHDGRTPDPQVPRS